MMNGKRYIGQKKFDIEMRWNSYMGSGYHLMKSINKYGKENFKRDIVDIAYSIKELNIKEEDWINEYDAVNDKNYYNMVDGGDVSERIAERKSLPVICIDNYYVFKSINDASLWSGHSNTLIKNTFNRIHKFNIQSTSYIFRPLSYLELSMQLCQVCGCNFEPSGNSTLCLECRNEKNKSKGLILRYNKSDNNGNELVHLLNDEWVTNKVINFRDNPYLKYIFKPYKKPKSKQRKYTRVKEKKDKFKPKSVEVSIKDSVLELNKELMINLYCVKKKSVEYIRNSIENYDGDTNRISNKLKSWGIKIRPAVYNNYSNPIIVKDFTLVKINKDVVFVFKYIFELKYWLEKYHTAKISKSYIEQILLSDKPIIKSFTIKRISEDEFSEHKSIYKMLDQLEEM